MSSERRVRVWTRSGLRAAFQNHPLVEWVGETEAHDVEFEAKPGWRRWIDVDRREGLRGLVELMDNNPLVCTDGFSTPGVGGTLALIALGPLARAGLILEPPAILASFQLDEGDVLDALATEGWSGGITPHAEAQPPGSVVALNAMALVRTEGELDEMDDLFAEAYGRSFYVRRMEEGDWDVDLVSGQPFAAFRLRATPAEGQALLTVQTMADLNGKVGAGQVVHAFNVMSGFEESLGIATL